jgi:glutamyl/glutaminyl-tRNA synthetase
VLGLVQDRLKTLSDLPLLTSYFFEEPVPKKITDENKQLMATPREELISLLKTVKNELESAAFDSESLQNTLNSLLEKTGQKPPVLFGLIRLAVSWAPFSPALNQTLAVLGRDKVLSRLQSTIDTALE